MKQEKIIKLKKFGITEKFDGFVFEKNNVVKEKDGRITDYGVEYIPVYRKKERDS